jgi:hypothetical protein
VITVTEAVVSGRVSGERVAETTTSSETGGRTCATAADAASVAADATDQARREGKERRTDLLIETSRFDAKKMALRQVS